MQPPAQELQARDLHDNVWTFRHIYRGKQTIATIKIKKIYSITNEKFCC